MTVEVLFKETYQIHAEVSRLCDIAERDIQIDGIKCRTQK